MGNHEGSEAIKSADSTQESKLNNLGAYTLEHNATGHTADDHKQKTDNLVDKGLLPSIALLDTSIGFQGGPEASAKEIRDAGVKCHHDKDGSTTAEYPTGVKLVSSGESHSEKGNIKIDTSIITVEATPPNHTNSKGEVVNKDGKVLAKSNEDGSITVDSGDGGFFTQYQDGTIKRQAAIRSRDGKTFENIDTDTPLGNLRPSDMTNHK